MNLEEVYKKWKAEQEKLTPYPTFDLYDYWAGRVGRSTVKKWLDELVKQGRARRELVGKQYRYRIL